jgi:hypothetical protein
MPEGSKVDKVYKALLSEGKSEESAAKIAQAQTGEALATGKPPKHENAISGDDVFQWVVTTSGKILSGGKQVDSTKRKFFKEEAEANHFARMAGMQGMKVNIEKRHFKKNQPHENVRSDDASLDGYYAAGYKKALSDRWAGSDPIIPFAGEAGKLWKKGWDAGKKMLGQRGDEGKQYSNCSVEFQNGRDRAIQEIKTRWDNCGMRVKNYGKEYIDHVNYPKKLKTKSDDELRFIIKDAQEAMKAMPDGPKAGYYADEVNYASMELRKRGQKR